MEQTNTFPMKIIARIRTDFPEKFGIPRQSGLVDTLRGEIVFEPEFRNADAVRGLEGFSHIWLIWAFSQAVRKSWSPTVRPPRLGGNARMGVFATRSPFRPNPIGLSCVKLEGVELTADRGPVIHVSGADLLDGTPFSTSSLTFSTPTAGPAPWGAGPAAAGRTRCCRWSARRSCCSPCRRTGGRPCWGCWPTTPAPTIRTTRSGSTVCALPGATSASPWQGKPSPWWRSPRRRNSAKTTLYPLCRKSWSLFSVSALTFRFFPW